MKYNGRFDMLTSLVQEAKAIAVGAWCSDERVESALAVQMGRDQVETLVKQGRVAYGINTGVGFLHNVVLDSPLAAQLQRNILRSHACGVGELLPREAVAMMQLLLLRSAGTGQRGLRQETLAALSTALAHGVLPCVPSRGSVGASGDLAPAAHAALLLIGEGECTVLEEDRVVRMPANQGLTRLGISPLTLEHKEGLGLINGTQLTTALALLGWSKASYLLRIANMTTAMSMLGAKGFASITHEEVLKAHRHEGTLRVGWEKQSWLKEFAGRMEYRDEKQDPYCLRCAVHVHGAVWTELKQSAEILEAETSAITDNPILFPEIDMIGYGGNFHAINTARVSDRLASALTTLGTISERRTNLLMNGAKTGLPHFLVADGGQNSGFMMIQVTAAALVSEAKSLSFPASVDSIPTNCDQEDHVSMGPTAGHKLHSILEKIRYVLAIELICACQAVYLRGLPLPPRLQEVYESVRERVAPLTQDRILSYDIEAVSNLIEDEGLLPL